MPAKRTTEEIDRMIDGRPLVRVGDYVNYDTKIEWKCSECSHIWSASPNSIISRRSGCPKCGQITAGKKKSAGQYDRAMNALAERKITLMSPYTRIKDHHDLKCEVCSFEWRTTLNIIVNHKRGCASCSGLVRLTNEDVDRRLVLTHGHRVARVGDYVNATTKIKWRCNSDHEWIATPDSVLNFGSGCPICGAWSPTRGYFKNNPEKGKVPGVLYLIEGHDRARRFLKVGITEHSVQHRFKQDITKFKINQLHVRGMSLLEAFEAEQQFLRDWHRSAYVPHGQFHGKTECLEHSQEIIDDFVRRFP